MTQQTETQPTAKAKGADLKALAKAIRASLIDSDDCILDFSEGHITSRFVGQENAMMGQVSVPYEGNATGEFGVNVGRLVKVTKRLAGDVDIAIKDMGGIASMEFVCGGAASRMALVDHRHIQVPKFPTLDGQDCVIETTVSDFADAVKDCNEHSDAAWFIVEGDRIFIQSRTDNNELSSVAVEIDGECSGEGRSLYSCDFLLDILKAGSGDLRIDFAADYPATFTTSATKHMVAPRILQN